MNSSDELRVLKTRVCSSAFDALLRQHFGKTAPLIFTSALSDGLIGLGEDMNPVGVVDGDIVPLAKNRGKIVANLRKHFSNFVIPAGSSGSGKTITRAEFDALDMQEQAVFCVKEGGTIEG